MGRWAMMGIMITSDKREAISNVANDVDDEQRWQRKVEFDRPWTGSIETTEASPRGLMSDRAMVQQRDLEMKLQCCHAPDAAPVAEKTLADGTMAANTMRPRLCGHGVLLRHGGAADGLSLQIARKDSNLQ